jgi:tight adherence protein B
VNAPKDVIALALVAGALAGAGTVTTAGTICIRPGKAWPLLTQTAAGLREALGALLSADVPMTRARRRRLQAVAGLAGFVGAILLIEPAGAILPGAGAAWLAPRVVSARRARHGRRVEEGAGPAALAIAGALSAGMTARSAICAAAIETDGAIARELGRTAWELEMGAGTDAALHRLVARCCSRSLALIAAAIQVQRHAGGDLAQLMRGIAASIQDELRVAEEARTATSQARFTAAVVIGLPVCGIALGELASPGLVGRMVATGVGIGLLTAALLLQVCGALAIRRLGRASR